ncbi:MAG: NAD-dependent epimerase/dehydratase family protein [Acidobacteriota bacterium]
MSGAGGARLLVTGATGFLGRNVAAALMAHGARLSLLSRRADAPIPEGASVVKADLASDAFASELGPHLDGLDGILHMAALVKSWVKDRTQFDRINVRAFETILELARARSLPVWYVSSFIALGPTDGTAFTESDTRRDPSTRNDYERTKTIADAVARRAQASGMPLTVVNPGVIYGPGELTEGNIMVNVARDFARGKVPGILGGGTSRWSYAFVDDVVAGIAAAVERGKPGERYLLGGDNRTGKEFFDVLADALGKPRLKRSIPYGLAKMMGAAEVVLAELFGRNPSLTPAAIEIFKHDWALDSSKAKAELGYRVTPLEEGLGRTVAWLRREKLAP